MPLPWKNSKCTRISRLVADHLHLPKHGGSLIFETGFPTSLVDLYVKNRDRLKKPSKRNKPTHPDPTIQPCSPSPLPSSKNSVKQNTSSSSSVLASELKNPNQRSCEAVIGNVESNAVLDGDGMVENGVQVVTANRVFVAVLKMFFLVVLALGTKKFTVGITISALLLFLIDYVGRRVCKSLKPRLNSLIKRGFHFFQIKQDSLVLKEEFSSPKAPNRRKEVAVYGCSGSILGYDLNVQNEEIEIVQPKSDLVCPVEETQCVKEKSDKTNHYKNRRYEELDSRKGIMDKEEDFRYEVSDSKNPKSRKSKMKSKMKKFILKKLRHSKKKVLDSKGEVYSLMDLMAQDKAAIREEQDDVKDEERHESDDGDNSLSSSSGMLDGEVDDICSSGELLQGNAEIAAKQKGNARYLALFLIVLFGLVGGRILALVLTLSWWCFWLNSGETIRRYVKIFC